MKTLAIRLEDDTHAQLSMLAQLEELTVTDAIRQAIDSFIEAKRSQPELTERAEAVLADIDRDAASRREAIASLFKGDGPTLKAVESTEAKPPLDPAPSEVMPRLSRQHFKQSGGGSLDVASQRLGSLHHTSQVTERR